MNVSIIVCTWNRAARLDEALAALAALRVPPGLAWEVLVVRNACTDASEDVIARHAGALPLRSVAEPELGLSRARNRALAAARGALLLWVDDDVRVEREWLGAYVEAAERHPEASFFGGPLEPRFSVPPPAWARCAEVIEGPLAALRLGPETRPLRDHELPYGGNLGLRAAAVGPPFFDLARGRLGANLRSGEETGLVATLRAAGHTGIWVGCARAAHTIPRERLTPAYLFAYHRARGRARPLTIPPAGPALAGAPWAWWREYAAARIAMARRAHRRDRRWARAVEQAALLRGRIDRARAARGGRSDPATASPAAPRAPSELR